MTILQDILAAIGWQTRVTENFRSVAPSGLYGIDPATTTGLTLGYLGGEFNGVTVANGTVVLTASNTNYVVAHRTTGAVTAATSTTNWNDTTTYLRLYQLVAGTSTFTIASTSDKRQAFGAVSGGTFTGGTLATALNEAPQVTLASSSTVNIGAAAANSVTVTGTTTINAFDSIAAGAKRELVFSGALTLTHNATSLILPTGANITTAAGDVADFVSLGSGNWRCTNYMRASGAALTGSPFTGGTLTSALNEATPVALASAATVSIGAAAANTVTVSGTTTITAFDTIAAGAIRRVRFLAALTFTHNATSLILPGSANITTAAGDVATMESLGSGNWRCVNYSKADGTSVVGGGGGGSGTVTSVDATGGLETTSGSAITAAGTIRLSELVNAQTGTTYTYVTGDRGKLVTHSNASAIAGTLPQATGTFPAGWRMRVKNKGAGTLTITPTTSTIDGAATLVLTTGQWATITSDGTNYQALTYAPAGGGGGLTNWTEAANSSSPNATIPVVSFAATNAATNVDAAIIPKGTGAILAAVPDSTSAGGNKRGIGTTDLQRTRSTATQVASGNSSVIAGGENNTASAQNAVVGGGKTNTAAGQASGVLSGESNTATAQYDVVVGGASNTANAGYASSLGGTLNQATGQYASVLGGYSNRANGTLSIAMGNQSSALAIYGAKAFASGTFAAIGDAQRLDLVLRCDPTNATVTRMTSDNSTAATTNQLLLQNNSSAIIKGVVSARQNTTGDTKSWEFTAHIKRGANAAATAMVAACTPTVIANDSGASTWALTVTADTTNGALAVDFTGEASKTIRAVCTVLSACVTG